MYRGNPSVLICPKEIQSSDQKVDYIELPAKNVDDIQAFLKKPLGGLLLITDLNTGLSQMEKSMVVFTDRTFVLQPRIVRF